MIRDDACTMCKLGAAASSPMDVCVPGIGRRRPKLMIVSKTPLSSKRRQEMIDYFAGVQVDQESLYFTAANRCRVWDVEAGVKDVKACRHWLDQEIAEIAPELIIPMGNEALLSVTGRSGIMKYRGKKLRHRETGIQAVPTISPAMVARNPGLRDGFVADLAYIRHTVDGTEAPGARTPVPLGVHTREGLVKLAARLRAAHGAAIDIETNSFNEHAQDGLILSIAITFWDEGDDHPRDVWALPLAHPESPFLGIWRKIVKWLFKLLKPIVKIIAHNGKFDLRWLHQFKCPIDETFDTMLAAHLLDENRPKALESLARTLLGAKPWKIDNKILDQEPLRKVLWYNAMDTWWTAGLYFILKKQILEQPRLARILAKMLMPASNQFVEIERRGIWVDREALMTNSRIAWRTLRDIDKEIMTFIPDQDEWPENIREANFNPSNFARWWLFEWMGYPILKRGKDKDDGTPGAPSMAESIMLTLRDRFPDDRLLELMIERTKWQKYTAAFFAAYEMQITGEDRIHTTFKLTGTVTGRLSSGKSDDDKVTGRVQNRGVNLQQVPRDNFVRGIFGAPPGSVFVECDYSQVELRIAAFLAREPAMLKLYALGQDIHMTMAMRMTGKPASQVTKEERKKAKAVNFGFLYGMGWFKFTETAWSNYGVKVTEQEAKAFRRAFFDQFPALIPWHNRQRVLAAKYKRVESPIGRIRHLPDIDSPNEGVRHEAERQAINSPVQSFASDMCLYSLVRLTKIFHRLQLRSHSVGTVHDAINFEIPLDEVATAIPMIKYEMENLPLERDFGVVLDVPIVADVKIGMRWGSAIEVPGEISSSPNGLVKWLRDHHEEIGLVA